MHAAPNQTHSRGLGVFVGVEEKSGWGKGRRWGSGLGVPSVDCDKIITFL